MTKQCEEFVCQCQECRTYQWSLREEPLLKGWTPFLPFELTSVDVFSCQGWDFLTYVDYLTGWPCVVGRSMMSSLTYTDGFRMVVSLTSSTQMVDRSSHLANLLNSAAFGRSSMSSRRRISHKTVFKAMKMLIMKTIRNGNLYKEAFRPRLLEWRNTPSQTNSARRRNSTASHYSRTFWPIKAAFPQHGKTKLISATLSIT